MALCALFASKPGNLPKMPVGVLKVARITTPERIRGWLCDERPCVPGLLHHGIDLRL
jgi:hypothetical protein